MVDYSAIYDAYWQHPGRLGESSFDDPAPIARQVLAICAPGRLLDVGSGMGALVLDLLKQGTDAVGVDVSTVAVEHCNRYSPGRFFSGSVLKLPFQDKSFDTLTSTGCLEYLAPEDVPLALREMHRVSRRTVFLRIAIGADAGGHLQTIENRSWWEAAAFAAGFRKHPRYYEITAFHALEGEDNIITIPLEKVPDDALAAYPIAKLLEHRELHMDMSRETGRRSDAHMARYHLAASYIRDGDTVLDSACGMGYGSRVLAWQSGAAKVIGMDLDQEAVLYATKNFAQEGGRISFQAADVLRLDFLPDNSIDVFVSFETLEHVPHPDRLIAQAKRILRPGGRLIVSVPNLWVNEEGIDPNPYHLHVYDWRRLTEEIQSNFLLETAYAQIAGGGMKLNAHPRSLLEFSPQGSPPAQAEWWLAVGMKDPIESKGVPYKETALHWNGSPPNAAAFARDYENPWLVRGIVAIGWRNRNPIQRGELARRALEESSPNSPDTGAALCVLGYGLLESSDRPTPAFVHALVREIDAYLILNGPNPHCRRWEISLMYVRGLLWQAIGDLKESLDSFEKCAAADPLAYSPLLATKTVDACRLAGMLSFQAGKRQDATAFWSRGITLTEKALRADWREIYGDIDYPFPFGLREAAQLLDIASRCADGLRHLKANVRDRGISDDGSFVGRLSNSDRRLKEISHELKEMTRALVELKSSPGARLQRAMQEDSRSFRRLARVTYLLALILLPARVKTALKPLTVFLRKFFGERETAASLR